MLDVNNENMNTQEVQPVEAVVAAKNIGDSQATTSLVLGILSLVCVLTVIGSIAGLVLGIVGLVMAHKSNQLGCNNGKRTAGFVCSVVGVVLNSLCLLFVVFGLVIASTAVFWWL